MFVLAVSHSLQSLRGRAGLWYLPGAVSSGVQAQGAARKALGAGCGVAGWEGVSQGSLKLALEHSCVWLKPSEWDHWVGMLAWGRDMDRYLSSSRNKKRIHVHITYAMGTLNGLKLRSDGILFVSESHGAVW